MRPKRQKPSQESGPESGQGSGQKSGRRRGRRFKPVEYGRQIDADLTDEADSDSFDPDAGIRLSGAEFPDVDPPDVSSGSGEEPEITHAIVRERAMRLLVAREHGRKELEKKLLQRELPPDLIVSVLDQLAQEGLQCDARFAESYTRMRVDRGYGANKVRADLQARRLEQSYIEEAISDSGADWTMIASGALQKKFGVMPAANSKAGAKTRAKMQRFLYQRGFEPEQIRSAMNDFEIAQTP